MSFYTDHRQYILRSAGVCSMGWDKAPPRWWSVKRVMEAEGLIDRWCYGMYLWPILERYRATNASSCADVVRLEKIMRTKDGVQRGVLEALGRPLDPDLGIIEVGGLARLADVRATVLDIEMAMGSTGVTVEEFPLTGFRNMLLVRVLDARVAHEAYSNFQMIRGQTNHGQSYFFNARLHHDTNLGQNIVPVGELAQKLARGPLPELAGFALNRAPSPQVAAKVDALSSLQKQLAELQKRLEKM